MLRFYLTRAFLRSPLRKALRKPCGAIDPRAGITTHPEDDSAIWRAPPATDERESPECIPPSRS
jgi:hypothetical protein